jgi:hypothetical protein
MIVTSRHKYGLDLFGCWGLGMDPNPNLINPNEIFCLDSRLSNFLHLDMSDRLSRQKPAGI